MTNQKKRAIFNIEVMDDAYAALNPWGLTAAECLCVRKVCELGGMKQAVDAAGVSGSVFSNTLNSVREKMNVRGQNVRLWIMWDRWVRSDANKPAAVSVPQTTWVR